MLEVRKKRGLFGGIQRRSLSLALSRAILAYPMVPDGIMQNLCVREQSYGETAS